MREEERETHEIVHIINLSRAESLLAYTIPINIQYSHARTQHVQYMHMYSTCTCTVHVHVVR